MAKGNQVETDEVRQNKEDSKTNALLALEPLSPRIVDFLQFIE